jgi:hypothetical protein
MFGKKETVMIIGGKADEKWKTIEKYNKYDDNHGSTYTMTINGNDYSMINMMYAHEDRLADLLNGKLPSIGMDPQNYPTIEHVVLVVCIAMDQNQINCFAEKLNCLVVNFDTAGYPDINTLLSACVNPELKLEIEKTQTEVLGTMQLVKAGAQSENSPFHTSPQEVITQILQWYIRLEFNNNYQSFTFFKPIIAPNEFFTGIVNFGKEFAEAIEEGIDSLKKRFG